MVSQTPQFFPANRGVQAVFGAGPVGIMAAYSAILRGASKTFIVDRVPERLAKAKEIGAIPIDFSKGDPVDQIEKLNGGLVDRAVDAVGYQAVGATGDKEQPNIVLTNLIRVVRPTGGLGIPGLYVPGGRMSLLQSITTPLIDHLTTAADPGAPVSHNNSTQHLPKLSRSHTGQSIRRRNYITSVWQAVRERLVPGHGPMQRQIVQSGIA